MTEITTVQELDALPVGSVARDSSGTLWEHVTDKLAYLGGRQSLWVSTTRVGGWTAVANLPFTVLHRPDAPAPSAEGGEAEFAWHEAHGPVIGDERYMPVTIARRLAARQPAPSFTPAQRHAAEQDEALFRVATRAGFGTGEVIDIVLRALGVPVVAPVVSAYDLEVACYPHQDPSGPDLRAPVAAVLDSLGIEVQDRG